jgi:hypothetical protein
MIKMMRTRFLLLSVFAAGSLFSLTACGTPEVNIEPTPTAQLAVPGDLESALANGLLDDPAALCEWEVWGQTEQALYLWAVCESAGGTAISAPAVVYLDAEGHVAAVAAPGDGTEYVQDVRRLFPPDLQERILAHEYDAGAAMERMAEREKGNGEFAIYLIDQTVSAQEMLQADLAELELEDAPILSIDDVVAYTWATHEIQLTDSAYARMGELRVPVQGFPFIVCVGRERVYGGAFWAAYSSVSFPGVVVDVMPAITNRPDRILRVQLGYPESPELFAGEDPRPDARIMASLRAADKLR